MLEKSKAIRKIERNKTRWQMFFYDTIIYVVCWLVFFFLGKETQAPHSSILYGAIGYVIFSFCKFILKCYRQIIRYGLGYAFFVEISADAIATAAFCLLVKLLEIFQIIKEKTSILFLILFAAAYMVLCVAARLLYFLLYRFAKKDTALSRLVRKLLVILAFVDFSSTTPGAILKLKLTTETEIKKPDNVLQSVIGKFAIRGAITNITKLNKGYINQTYRIETISDTGHIHKYTLQRINTNVFRDVEALMNNFKITTEHLHGRLVFPGSRKMGAVQIIRNTKDGRSFLKDESGCWRMLKYFDDAYSLDIPDKPETFYYAGVVFGSFLKEMQDVDINDIKEVIPNFHNTKSRYLDLEKAIKNDAVGRVKEVSEEIEFIRERSHNFGIISDALEKGEIPTRICHNDCNLNNVLFDNKTNLPIAIIDLDTVMPSSPLYDYGDSMRIGTNTAKDDEKDLTKVSCDLNLYEQYARGYLEVCGSILTREELRLLPYASLIITSEDGIRFLMDYINGDTYYHTDYEGQNLDRARTQLKLVSDMEAKLPRIKEILQKIYEEQGITDINLLEDAEMLRS